mgnify:CR=1 FL=1
MYIPVSFKLAISMAFSFAWVAFATWLALPWVDDLTLVFNAPIAWIIVAGIAIIPGFANSFIIPALILDKRPKYFLPHTLPDITIAIAAYNEEDNILDVVQSIQTQEYPGNILVYVVDDGSTDSTPSILKDIPKYNTKNIKFYPILNKENKRKAGALNTILNAIDTEYVITIDADSYLFENALAHLVNNIVSGPPNTGAVAGTVLVRNSRSTFMSSLQEWDYFHGIAVIKRIQSLFQGTLVAQGAFSVYRTDALQNMGGWDETSVGEDIVLTWGLRQNGWRVGYAENAFCFTNVPETYGQFYNQRVRWAKGLIEAFIKYPKVIWDLKPNSPFIWLNLTFPFTDLIFVTVFIPGMIAAIFFSWFKIVSLMTVLLLPLAVISNVVMYRQQRRIFEQYGLVVRKNILGLLVYMFIYQFVMVPATFIGYYSEIFRLKKGWGTK